MDRFDLKTSGEESSCQLGPAGGCPSGPAGSCHGPVAVAPRTDAATVALLGLPNTGKSTLYSRLTGRHAHIANWPGLTVDLLRGDLPNAADGRRFQLVDLPGIHDLGASSEDEAIVRRFLERTPPDLALVVINASQITTQLSLALQVQALGIPMLLALNMSDEALRFGIRIDARELGRRLGIPVVAINARASEGLGALLEAIHRPVAPEGQPRQVAKGEEDFGSLDRRLADVLDDCVELPARLGASPSRRIDRVLLHPLVGPTLFLAIVLVMFQAIYVVGGSLQEGLAAVFDAVQARVIEPVLAGLGAPELWRGFLVGGVWLGITTVLSFTPIIFVFYLLMAVVEDSGYLPRAAFLMDGFMHWLGLDGRAFVLQVMGFGCNVPSILGTRVIRDRSMRLLAMLVIPFALCQARLTVFIFLAAIFFPRPWWAPGLVVFGFYLISFAAAILTGVLFKRAYRSDEAFVLELPPYRNPSLGTILRRAWVQMLNFLSTTRTYIVLGAAAVWLLTNLPPAAAGGEGLTLAARFGGLFQPLLAPIGMTPDLTVSLFFGFIAKEILLGAMAVIYRTSETGLGTAIQSAITPLQALSFMTFTLLYTPCLSTVVAQLKESRSRSFTLLSVGWSLVLAWLMALLIFQGGRRLIGLGWGIELG